MNEFQETGSTILNIHSINLAKDIAKLIKENSEAIYNDVECIKEFEYEHLAYDILELIVLSKKH